MARIEQNPWWLQSIVHFTHYLGIHLYPHQLLWCTLLEKSNKSLIYASRRSGKMLREDEVILTNRGWVQLKDLTLEDKVYGSDGKLADIDFKTELQENLEMYRITLRDGRTIDCCEDHLWKVFDRNNQSKWVKGKTLSVGQENYRWSVKSTKDMAKLFKYTHNRNYGNSPKKDYYNYLYALPLNEPIDYPEKELPLDPYILGVLLGDGCLKARPIKITSQDEGIINKVQSLLPQGYRIHKLSCAKYDYSIIKDGADKEFGTIIKNLGLLNKGSLDKFIPEVYKTASIEQRFELLRGLMDTDGTTGTTTEFYTISPKLKDDIVDLTRSLGIYTRFWVKKSYYKGKRYNDCYCVVLSTNKKIFNLERKHLIHQIPHSKQAISRYSKVFITNIEKLKEKGKGYCIGVKNEDRTYITKDYIVTHNSYAVTLFLTYMALKYPKGGVSIVCPALSQAKRNLETIRNFIASQPKLDPYIDRRFGLKGISQTKIRLANHTVLEAFGIKSNIDSVNSTIAYIDEYADCCDNIINERVLPSLAAKRKDGLKSKIIYSGVPKFINDNIYSIVNDPGNKGTNILPVVRYTDAIELGALDPSSVDMIKSAITDDEFERAFNCNWTQDTFSYLTNEILYRCQNIDTYSLTQYIKPGEAIIGFDMSGRGESSGLNSKHAAIVFQKFTDTNRNKECFRLTQIRLWDQDYPLEALKQDLKDMWFENKCRFGLYDMFGDTFMNGVQKEIFGKTNDECKDLPWQGIRYGDFVKHQMFSNAKVLMETGRLLLPVEEPESFDFYQHIRNCQTERSSKNILLYKKKKTREPDDLLQAMVLCLYCERHFELKSNDYTPVAFAF